MMTGWVIARKDEFGPTLYKTAAETWVFGDQASERRIFTDDEKLSQALEVDEQWEPSS